MDDVHRIRHELDYPVFIKTYYSHLWRAAFPTAGKGTKAHTPDELVAGFECVYDAGIEAMVQEIIQGPASNVRTVRVYIAEDGDLLATLRSLIIPTAATGVAAAVLMVPVERMTDPAGGRSPLDFAGFGLAVAVVGGVYLVVAWLLRVPELSAFLAIAERRLGSRIPRPGR